MESLFLNSRIKLSQGLLFWREAGVGSPIVFLHGAWTDGSQWVSVMESLSRDFHCFAPDLLGFGESDFPDVHYSIDLQLESLGELLRALKLEKVYLVGHSIGGWIAASYALKYPEQVIGLVLIAPEGVDTTEQVHRRQKMQKVVKRSPFMFSLLRLLRPIAKIFGVEIKVEEDWQLHELLQQFPTSCELIFQRQQPSIEAELLQNRLYSLEMPVLVLQGGKDAPDAIAMTRAYVQLIPQAQLKIIAHAGHDMPFACAGVTAGEIRDFIKGEV